MQSVAEFAETLGRAPRILIVDDDVLIRFAFSAIQQKYYLDVDCVSSPDQGLQKIQSEKYSAIFLDMKFNAGDADGMETLRRMNLLNFSAQVIVMSGSINLHDVMAEANRLGVLSFMIKPINFSHDYVVSILRRLAIRLVERPPDDPGPKPEIPKL